MYFNNDLDNQLFAEFRKDNPNELRIRALLKQGANINAIDSIGYSILMNAIEYDLDIKMIQLIIELGADINYECDGLNCLDNACGANNIELVELLLKAGANPNCVVCEYVNGELRDYGRSLLDDYSQHESYNRTMACNFDEAEIKIMGKIVHLLEEYGAKTFSEITKK